jgi:integrase
MGDEVSWQGNRKLKPGVPTRDVSSQHQNKGTMDQDQNISLLFIFYFGDSAASAQKGASQRLKKWSRAFDHWIEERLRDYQKGVAKQARLAWRRLVRHIGKMPWQITKQDIESHLTWMEQEGFARSTINPTLGIIAGFYRWCDEHQVDPLCPRGFNPAKGVKRIKYVYYEGTGIWTRTEVGAFLDLLSRDKTQLGKREYAYFLARINLGVKLNYLQQLKWEQLEVDEAGAWVRWRLDGEQVRLPNEVWKTIKEYLRVSGRLEGMRAGKYIFAALATPGREITGGKAEDWIELHPIEWTPS